MRTIILFTIAAAAALLCACQSTESAGSAEQISAENKELENTFEELKIKLAKLRPQSIRPAEGFIKYDYLIPAGFYKQMWDWDGFFIGAHLASRSKEEAKYLKFWVLNFAEAIDEDGYVAGCVTTAGPRPIFGKFAMKPFLSQGAYFASERLGDYSWLEEIYPNLKKVIAYREKTQYDSSYKLFFWDNAMQSGADNNVALTNDENDRSSTLAVDATVFALREYKAMAKIAAALGQENDAREYLDFAASVKGALMEHMWHKDENMFYNLRRDNGQIIKRISYSNFLPLFDSLLPQERGKEMIRKYLWNKDHMLAEYGLRTLSKADDEYNNVNMIKPYSNWQGPVWPVANYIYSVMLKNYGFDQEAKELAFILGKRLVDDINEWGSMHENYHADTGAPLAPSPDQSNGKFTGFVGWNMLVENMLQGAVEDQWLLLQIK